MDDEQLIEAVRGYPELYDQSCKKYMDSNFKNSLWKRIAMDINGDWTAVKARWTNIRDQFRKSLNKQKTKSGQSAKNFKPYKYSEPLQFLIRFFEERETISNIAEEATNQCSTEEQQEEFTDSLPPESDKVGEDPVPRDTATAEDRNEKASPSTDSSRPIGSKPKKMKYTNDTPAKTAAATLVEYLVKKNEQTMTAQFPAPPDPVDAFLSGIAPTLKKLTPRDWYLAKGEIFAVVQRFEYDMVMKEQLPDHGPQSSRQPSYAQTPHPTCSGYSPATPSLQSGENSSDSSLAEFFTSYSPRN